MLCRALVLAHCASVALGSIIAGRTGGGPTVKSYLATFEDLQANVLPVLSTAEPPSPYQGLNYDGAVVVKDAPVGQFVTDLQTTQGSQFIGVNTLSSVSFSVPNAGETFDLKSAYLGIFLSTDNSAIIPAVDGTLAFTGTKPDGSKVVETVEYKAAGTGILKEAGIVLLGKAILQKATFCNLNGVTIVEVTVQDTATPVGPLISLLGTVGLDVSTAVYAMALDSLEYEVTISH
ncbi:hypothetical protein F5884DRAFT_746379 [Xylogone sp. PMI_703]|nr:hypothetical protein F5884DRAFT_746379 [Xylogone sp. PMI_703]